MNMEVRSTRRLWLWLGAFSLLLVLVVGVACLGFIDWAARRNQDWNNAIDGMRQLGFSAAMEFPEDRSCVVRATYCFDRFDDRHIDALHEQLTAMASAHDWWMVGPFEVALIDVSRGHVSDRGEDKLRRLFPAAEIRR